MKVRLPSGVLDYVYKNTSPPVEGRRLPGVLDDVYQQKRPSANERRPSGVLDDVYEKNNKKDVRL